MALIQRENDMFELVLDKRGRRSGALAPNGLRTTSIWLKQDEKTVCWHQTAAPPDDKAKPDKSDEAPLETLRPEALDAFLQTLTGEHFKSTQLVARIAKHWRCSQRKAYALLPEIKARLTFDPEFETYTP